ncbi:MAG TPA: hypothetical protein VGA00_11340 [Acidiferrobacterales bacterium]
MARYQPFEGVLSMQPVGRVAGRLIMLVSAPLWAAAAAGAEPAPAWSGRPVMVPAAAHAPTVIPAARLESLLGAPLSDVGLFALRDGRLVPVPFQIDARDASGRYRPDEPDGARRVGPQDEWVFMAVDAGARLPAAPLEPAFAAAHAIELRGDGASAWLYALAVRDGPAPRNAYRHVRYDARSDAIVTAAYRIGFSRDLPFLIDKFQWAGPDGAPRTANLIDGMKVRHTGRLFGVFDFHRTEADYQSERVAVKAGPVRVIRRTRSRVRMFLGLRTPSIHIDYLAHRNRITMDLIVDLPFAIGLFLSDVETLTTVDWRPIADAGPMRMLTRAHPDGHVIDGRMSDAERAVGNSADTDYVITGDGGDILVTLSIDPALPIAQRIHLMDDQSLPDPPEAVVGQYGNSGFATTGWERVGRGVYHMLFDLTLVPDGERPRGPALLESTLPPDGER